MSRKCPATASLRARPGAFHSLHRAWAPSGHVREPRGRLSPGAAGGALLLALLCPLVRAERVQVSADFQSGGLSGWTVPKAEDWEIAAEGANRFLRLRKEGVIGEPRRPLQYALRQGLCVGDFDLRVKVRRTGKSMMIAFGYQDTLHFYYAHISADSGSHAVHNGLFQVNGGERFRIGGQGSAPVLPDQNWHEIRLVRRVAGGEIELWVDRDREPRFRHRDSSFQFGRVGLGSFNETGEFDDFRLEGQSSSECR